MYFDTHAHFDTFEADGSLPDVLDRAAAAGVTRMCAVGGSAAANALAVRLAAEHPSVLVAAAGYDRDQVGQPCDTTQLALFFDSPGVAAVGEVGLDYFYSKDTARAQRRLFEQMLALALELRRPVIVHSREADEDTLAMLGDFSTAWKKNFQPLEKTDGIFHSVEKKFPQCGKLSGAEGVAAESAASMVPPPGILHCYTGGAAFAEQLMELGMMISFSGIVSFNNAEPLRAVARMVPEGYLLAETDCPYLTPKPFRGKVNEPMHVARVVEVLAKVRGTTAERLAALTAANARKVFQLEEDGR